MAEHTFQLEVVTPDRVVLEEEVTALVAPGIEGYLGVLANHAPMVTELAVGELRYTDTHRHEHRLAVSGGFMQVAGNRTTVLADSAERAEEINTTRAREALDRARQLRAELGPAPDASRLAELDADQKRAENRLKIAGQ
jgi:F-type H+-transporting ATPase subunit epsilon